MIGLYIAQYFKVTTTDRVKLKVSKKISKTNLSKYQPFIHCITPIKDLVIGVTGSKQKDSLWVCHKVFSLLDMTAEYAIS